MKTYVSDFVATCSTMVLRLPGASRGWDKGVRQSDPRLNLKLIAFVVLVLTSSPLLAQKYTTDNWRHFQQSQHHRANKILVPPAPRQIHPRVYVPRAPRRPVVSSSTYRVGDNTYINFSDGSSISCYQVGDNTFCN